jgi:regulator of cell morphogenesis and NO signaling
VKATEGNLSPEEVTKLLASASIAQFTDHHDSIEDELKEVSTIVKRYSEYENMPLPYRIFLNQVELFELELRKHGIIEDHVLVPMAEELEKKLRG